MRWYALLPLAALLSFAHAQLDRNEVQGINLYYRDHRRVCGNNHFVVLTETGTNWTLRSSGVPSHNAARTSPYRPAIQTLVYNIAREPEVLDTPLCVPTGVPIGFARDGVPFYNALTKDWNNAVEGGCALQYDRCRADTDKFNQYHYRTLPDITEPCLNLAERNQDMVFLGVALDGFPIYYDRRRNVSTLDECGGRFMDPNNRRSYRYFIGDSYPYTIGCFRGKVNNISTLTECKGSDGDYGSLCACVNFGVPGFAAGYTWLNREDVTTGRCERRPTASSERTRELICDRTQIPAPEFLDEDMPSDTCIDFRSLYSLLTVWGQRGGLAHWTMLKNMGRLEDPRYEEEDRYVRHYKSLRWLLDDLDKLDWPYLEKRMEYERNKTGKGEPLCPREQRELRETLAQVWVLTYLRGAFSLPDNASSYERHMAQRMFHRLMWVLNALRAADIEPFVVRREDLGDPWGIWRAPRREEDDDGFGSRMDGLVSQLQTLQTLGNMRRERRERMMGGRGGDREDEDMRERMEYSLLQILRLLEQLGRRRRDREGMEGEGREGMREGREGMGGGREGMREGEGKGKGRGGDWCREGREGMEGEGRYGMGEGGEGKGKGMGGSWGKGKGMGGDWSREGGEGGEGGEGSWGKGKGDGNMQWGMNGRGERRGKGYGDRDGSWGDRDEDWGEGQCRRGEGRRMGGEGGEGRRGMGGEGRDMGYGGRGKGRDMGYDRREGREGYDRREGREGYDRREGREGYDRREGREGYDRREGREGYDRREGREGYDRREGREGYDRREGREGYDRREGREGYDRREGREGYDRREGREGYDRREGREGYEGRREGDREGDRRMQRNEDEVQELFRRFRAMLPGPGYRPMRMKGGLDLLREMDRDGPARPAGRRN